MPARHDRTSDPAILADLLFARRGQAYFSRLLHGLPDAALQEPSRLPGWSRAHVAAHVGLNARALTNLTMWAATGVETPMYEEGSQRDRDIELAATLPAHALRNLSDHAAIHLDVEWRDLAPDAWSALVRTAQGRQVPVSETAWMRAREVWIHAIDLRAGGRFADLPRDMLERLLRDICSAWDRRRAVAFVPSFVLEATDVPVRILTGDGADAVVVRGALADLAGWASGRTSAGLEAMPSVAGDDGGSHGAVPEAPRWL